MITSKDLKQEKHFYIHM